jgi:hypothetical protein
VDLGAVSVHDHFDGWRLAPELDGFAVLGMITH